MVAISFEYDSRKELANAIEKALSQVKDLKVPYTLMAQSWFKSNKSMFHGNIKGPRKYEDLTDGYKKQKIKKYGFIYPILMASGKLQESITNPKSPDSVNYIIDGKELVLGTRVTSKDKAPYAFFLHHGTSKMRPRPVVLFGVEQVATYQQNQRFKAWVDMLADYVAQTMGGKA